MSRPTPYIEKSLRFRRDRFVSTRWRVGTDAQGEGVFGCRHLVPGSGQWDAQDDEVARLMTQTHASIDFLSQAHARQGWWYRAQVSTVEQAVLESLERRIDSQLAQEQLSGWDYWHAMGQAWARLSADTWEALPVRVGVVRDLKAPDAVRLDVVLTEPILDVATLKRFVEGFWETGEKESSQPVDWARHRQAIQERVDQAQRVYSRFSHAPKQG